MRRHDIISKCFHDAGVPMQGHTGFCSYPFNFKDNGLSAFQAAVGVPTKEALHVTSCENTPFDGCVNICPTCVTPFPPSPVVTLHYMNSQLMKEVAEWHGARRWVVISAAISNNILTDPYMFSIPFTVAAWKRIGWSTVVILTGKIKYC
jgi:hypothetical protein